MRGNIQFKEWVLVGCLLGSVVLAVTDPNFRGNFATIVSSVVTGYFALSFPNREG
jgi:hypothetical protein